MDFKRVLNKDFLISWEGRINRQLFWMYVLVYIAGAIVVNVLDALIGAGGLLGTIYALALLYTSIVVQIKRWHDRDKSGLWVLINLIPLIGALWALIECGFLEGTKGPNRFGADPLGGTATVATV